MKQKLLFIFALLCTVAQGAWADASGSCGNGVTWSYVADTKILSIAKTGDGTGAMANYNINNQPWREFNITKVVIGEGVTSIGDDAFFVYPSLLSVEIPASVTSIGGSAFYKCTGLTSVSFATGSQLASIGTYAFYNCTSLASITIPNGVTTISNNAFNSAGLTSIAIPASVTSIGSLAFIQELLRFICKIHGSAPERFDITVVDLLACVSHVASECHNSSKSCADHGSRTSDPVLSVSSLKLVIRASKES